MRTIDDLRTLRLSLWPRYIHLRLHSIFRRIYPALPSSPLPDAPTRFTPADQWAKYVVAESDMRRIHARRELVQCIGLGVSSLAAFAIILAAWIVAIS